MSTNGHTDGTTRWYQNLGPYLTAKRTGGRDENQLSDGRRQQQLVALKSMCYWMHKTRNSVTPQRSTVVVLFCAIMKKDEFIHWDNSFDVFSARHGKEITGQAV
eukprot:8312114-Ditylum_brightwellii.AAC.1